MKQETVTKGNMVAERPKKRRSGVIQLAIVLGIIAVIGISFGVNVLGIKKNPGVPDTLLEMKLASYVDGQEALAQVNRLHGTEIPLTGAVIADYSHDFNPYHSNDDMVNVWIGKTRTKADANALVDRMYQAIVRGKGNTPFSNPRKIQVAGQDVYQVDGMGGEHYFYVASGGEPRLVWLTIESGNPPAVLREAIKVF